MPNNVSVTVEVAYATPTRQVILTVTLPLQSTVKEVILQSGILQQFPDIDLQQQTVGIFSKRVSLDTLVQAGERVEIYRPLTADPKDSRKLRFKKKSAALTKRGR